MWLIFFVFFILYFWQSNLYSRFLIFAFCICYHFCTFKNLIFSIHFHLGNWLLTRLVSPLLIPPSSPPGHLYLPLPSSPLHITLESLWVSLAVENCFTSNLNILSSVLYEWRSLKATVTEGLKARGRRFNSKTWELQRTPDSREH